ncbi:MAG: hypothetical protein H6924_10965 [Alphaproteobacteria bacterium]|nr:hypothetical protein [Alphaproteobacteria bacterium]
MQPLELTSDRSLDLLAALFRSGGCGKDHGRSVHPGVAAAAKPGVTAVPMCCQQPAQETDLVSGRAIEIEIARCRRLSLAGRVMRRPSIPEDFPKRGVAFLCTNLVSMIDPILNTTPSRITVPSAPPSLACRRPLPVIGVASAARPGRNLARKWSARA